ncbi:MAG: DUF433 domain-containing protein [Caldilineaceae bacterium]
MSAQPELLTSIPIQTEHPYIVRLPGIGVGAEPIIKGSRAAVRLIADYYKAGMAVEEIQRDYPYLHAAIYDAISFYIDHQAEIEALIEANRIEQVLNEANLSIDADGAIRARQEHQKA